MVYYTASDRRSKTQKRGPHLIAVPKGFKPHPVYPNETARFTAEVMRMTSMQSDRIDGDYFGFGRGLFRAMYGGTKAPKIKRATDELDSIEWKHESK